MPPLHLHSFLLGVVAARVYMEDRILGRRRNGNLLALSGIAVNLFALGGGVELLGHVIRPLGWPFPFGHNGLFSPVWGVVLLGLAHGAPSLRWMGARPLVRLGDASYGLYILHFPVYHAMGSDAPLPEIASLDFGERRGPHVGYASRS